MILCLPYAFHECTIHYFASVTTVVDKPLNHICWSKFTSVYLTWALKFCDIRIAINMTKCEILQNFGVRSFNLKLLMYPWTYTKVCANTPFTEAISHNCSFSTSEPLDAPTEDKFKCSKFSAKSQVVLLSTSLVFELHPFLFLRSNLFRNAFRLSWQNKQREKARVSYTTEGRRIFQLFNFKVIETSSLNKSTGAILTVS